MRRTQQDCAPTLSSLVGAQSCCALVGLTLFLIGSPLAAAPAPELKTAAFVKKYCANCHDGVEKEAGLDLTALKFSPGDPTNFATWVKVHDRAHEGEMPPKEKKRPDPTELEAFVKGLNATLTTAEREMTERHGRAIARRLNREEYENALRDLFAAPWLQVKGQLPEDGEAFRSNKVSRALDVSHVHVARYVSVVDSAIRQIMAAKFERPPTSTKRYYARENFTRLYTPQGRPDRSFFPALGAQAQNDVRTGKAPVTVGDSDPQKRELEAVGWLSSDHEGFHTAWSNFRAPTTGRYRIRFSGYTLWVGPYGPNMDKPDRPPRWWIPNFDDLSRGRRSEPIAVYSRGQGANYRLTGFDLTPEPTVIELEPVWLQANASLMTDAVRLSRGKPTGHNNKEESYFMDSLVQRDGAPAVAFRWMEVEGPLDDEQTDAGYRLLFGELRLRKVEAGNPGVGIPVASSGGARRGFGGRGASTSEVVVAVETSDPKADSERLLRAFMQRAFRRPVEESEVQRYLGVINREFANGHKFTEAMISGYTAVLCSPDFTFVDEKPGRLDDYALATRLSLFLINSVPDVTLRARAARGELHRPGVLRAETERLLNDPKSRRFVEAFLERWLDLKKMEDTEPSNLLYPDYYLDDALVEATVAETRLYFSDLLARNLPARNVVDSDYTFLNERLAVHYGIPGVDGIALRRVTLPPGSPRGGFMTQASILKVTANGTTTSPVIRGVWITERILGQTIHPPPVAVPAVEPDIRGAVTIRQQIEKHRADKTCASCHATIDPPGLALESFDVMGGWRDRYRATADGHLPEIGFGKNGWAYAFHLGLPVDASGTLPDGRAFRDVRDLKRLFLADETQIARNLARQLVVFATGAPVRFSDRIPIETILQETKKDGFGVRSLVHAIVRSELFLNK